MVKEFCIVCLVAAITGLFWYGWGFQYQRFLRAYQNSEVLFSRSHIFIRCGGLISALVLAAFCQSETVTTTSIFPSGLASSSAIIGTLFATGICLILGLLRGNRRALDFA
jgi:hypothetical protein